MRPEDEIAQYAKQFEAVDRRDPKQLRAWFLAHPDLTTHDHAQIASVSDQIIRRWKHKAGFPKHKANGKVKSKSTRKPPISIDIPEDWRDYNWLAEQLSKHSVGQVARALGEPNYTVMEVARRYKLTRPAADHHRVKIHMLPKVGAVNTTRGKD